MAVMNNGLDRQVSPSGTPLVGAALVIVVILAGLVAHPGVASAAPPPPRLWSEKAFAQPIDPDGPVSMRAFSRLAKELSPAVVNVTVSQAPGNIPVPFFAP